MHKGASVAGIDTTDGDHDALTQRRYRLLSDSNADWGQQLKSTKRYLDRRGVKDCWFIYFAEGVVDAGYYGIPCKPLPTADSLWVKEPANAPPSIDGTVLISAGDLSGFEYGAGALNPYEQFKTLRPTAVIDYGVFVYDGHFEIRWPRRSVTPRRLDFYWTRRNCRRPC